MAAISSPNLVRATMHMRGELGTNQKPLLVQTKSQGKSRILIPVIFYLLYNLYHTDYMLAIEFKSMQLFQNCKLAITSVSNRLVIDFRNVNAFDEANRMSHFGSKNIQSRLKISMVPNYFFFLVIEFNSLVV